MTSLSLFTEKHVAASKWPDLRVGWTVKIYQKVREGEKAKSQVFEGIIISKKHGNEPGGTITVRKAAGGYGVEKTLPVRLPSIEKIVVVRKSKVHRAKLYYLKNKTAKEIRKKTKLELVKLAGKAEPAPEVITESTPQ